MCLTPGQCGDLDYAVPYNPAGVFGRTDSVVAQKTEDVFSANVRTLRLSSGSQVWLVAHFHGPARTDDNRELARQLLTAQAPLFGVPGGGAFVDVVNGRRATPRASRPSIFLSRNDGIGTLRRTETKLVRRLECHAATTTTNF